RGHNRDNRLCPPAGQILRPLHRQIHPDLYNHWLMIEANHRPDNRCSGTPSVATLLDPTPQISGRGGFACSPDISLPDTGSTLWILQNRFWIAPPPNRGRRATSFFSRRSRVSAGQTFPILTPNIPSSRIGRSGIRCTK